MTKPPLYNGKRPHCCYCKRSLDASALELPTSMTWDHFEAESAGGRRKVPCCRKCNHLKDNLEPADWLWFIDTHPRWWKTFDYPRQVRAVVDEFRAAQQWARAREMERSIARIRRRNGFADVRR